MKKSFTGGVTIKDADKGELEAVFSKFNVIDLDGDVTLPGAFTEGASVVISAYGHTSHGGALPVGKGTIHEVDDEAIVRAKFFLKTSHGRDTWETVKELSADDLQEWSYSLDDVVAKSGVVDGQKVQIIEKVGLVKEVSPVLQGAGIGTRTLSTKSRKELSSVTRQALTVAARERWGADETWVWVDDYDPDEGFVIVTVETDDAVRLLQVDYTLDDTDIILADEETEVVRTVAYARKGKFTEQAAQVLASVDSLTERATGVMALRASKGKSLAPDSSAVLDQLDASMGRLKQLLTASSEETDTDPPVADPDADAAANEQFANDLVASQLAQGAP